MLAVLLNLGFGGTASTVEPSVVPVPTGVISNQATGNGIKSDQTTGS